MNAADYAKLLYVADRAPTELDGRIQLAAGLLEKRDEDLAAYAKRLAEVNLVIEAAKLENDALQAMNSQTTMIISAQADRIRDLVSEINRMRRPKPRKRTFRP